MVRTAKPSINPEPVGVGLCDFHQPLCGTTDCTYGFTSLVNLITDGAINLHPPYQRGHAWFAWQYNAFMGYVLEGGPMPDLWLRELPAADPSGYLMEVIDGKHRLDAIYRWWTGEIPARLSKRNGCREIWSRDLSDVERSTLSHDIRVSAQIVRDMTVKQVTALYLRINGKAGTPHTPEALAEIQAFHDSLPDD